MESRKPEEPRWIADIRGPRPGPTLLITAGIHGNEPAGVHAAKSVVAALTPLIGQLSGRLVVLLLLSLLPVARAGLLNGGVEPEEADAQLKLIEARVKSGITGSTWQLQASEAFGGTASLEARQALLARYLDLSLSEAPVHTWDAVHT